MDENPAPTKSDRLICQVQFLASYMMLGVMGTGAFFSWIPLDFDIRIIGAGIGLVAGLVTRPWN